MLEVFTKIFSRSERTLTPHVSFTALPASLPTLAQMDDLKGKRVLVRAPLNVPVEGEKVQSSFRLKSIIPTVAYLQKKGARVILLGHLGRDKAESLRPVYDALLGDVDMQGFLPLLSNETKAAIDALKDGEVIMLENLRSHEGEESNSMAFGAALAMYGDVYVNDAFADSHRAHASIVTLPTLLPSCFGPAFVKEYEALRKVMLPEHPSLFILGGAKFETKLPLIEKYLHIYDHVFVGGALANDLFKAKGYEVGHSLVSETELPITQLLSDERILLPVDVVVRGEKGVRVALPHEVKTDEIIFDAGPETMKMLQEYIKPARTILWNGPLGNYEEGFSQYTEECAKLVAASKAFSVLGGGDTIATIEALALKGHFGFLSTAGGAMLTFLESGTLPGIEAIRVS